MTGQETPEGPISVDQRNRSFYPSVVPSLSILLLIVQSV